jgi:hypothetical protein
MVKLSNEINSENVKACYHGYSILEEAHGKPNQLINVEIMAKMKVIA